MSHQGARACVSVLVCGTCSYIGETNAVDWMDILGLGKSPVLSTISYSIVQYSGSILSSDSSSAALLTTTPNSQRCTC